MLLSEEGKGEGKDVYLSKDLNTWHCIELKSRLEKFNLKILSNQEEEEVFILRKDFIACEKKFTHWNLMPACDLSIITTITICHVLNRS